LTIKAQVFVKNVGALFVGQIVEDGGQMVIDVIIVAVRRRNNG